MDQMGEMILLCSPGKPNIDFHHIGMKLRSNEKIDSEIHHHTKIPLIPILKRDEGDASIKGLLTHLFRYDLYLR
jgi:hypothetical protein